MSELPTTDPREARRRRRRRGQRRGLYLLPQLFTTANLLLGFFAIIRAVEGDYDTAALAIVLAVVGDGLDGRVARLSRATSSFGREYDSLADVVSFGVAPALLAYHAGNLHVLGRAGWVMAFLFTVCAALRLARFNVSDSRYRGRFEGLPSPAAAGVVATTQWFVSFAREQGFSIQFPEAVVAGGLIALGLLMVSAVPYHSFKELDLRHSYRTVVVAVLVLGVVAREPALSLFAIGLLYATAGPIEWLWRRWRNLPLEEVAPATPTMGESEETIG